MVTEQTTPAVPIIEQMTPDTSLTPSPEVKPQQATITKRKRNRQALPCPVARVYVLYNRDVAELPGAREQELAKDNNIAIY